MNPNITCKQAVDYISRKEEGKLSATQRFRLWQHLAGCSLCRIFSVQNKVIAKAYQLQEKVQRQLSSTEKQKIIEAVLSDTSN